MKKIIFYTMIIASTSLNSSSIPYRNLDEMPEDPRPPYPTHRQQHPASNQPGTFPFLNGAIPVQVVNHPQPLSAQQSPSGMPMIVIPQPYPQPYPFPSYAQPSNPSSNNNNPEQEATRRLHDMQQEKTIEALRKEIADLKAELNVTKIALEKEKYGWGKTIRHWGLFTLGAVISTAYWTRDNSAKSTQTQTSPAAQPKGKK